MVKYKEKTLDNGLSIIVNEDTTTELVAVNMLYKVGAKDEQEDHTGFAHLFEHLMFSGSNNYKDFDEIINSIGGESNAFTNNDYTNFYITVPYIYLDLVLNIEADRMRNLIIDQEHLSVQQKVVIEEFKQRYLNQPYGDLYKCMRELSYKVHPYKWQTIGKDISHIESATLDIVRSFYDKYYRPNNAILSISGNAVAEDVFEKVEKIFAFERGEDKVIEYKQESLQTENREETVYRDVPSDVIMITFPMCERNNKEFYVFDLLSDLLSNGKSSRMYQNLVLDKQIFTSIDAVVSADDDRGLFVVVGKYVEGQDIKEGERMIWEELENMIKEPITDREFQKVKNKNLANSSLSNLKILDKAMNMAYYAHLGILENINKDKEIYKNVTKDDVISLARKIFFENKHNTLYYLSKQNNKE
ncbi:MAG: insulinase family protein [Bacteroidales bacterium]|nr:insulinase family protein [Bacteroidales bacterium]